MLVDTHCHLYFDKFDVDRDSVIARMAGHEVVGAVLIGIDEETNAKAHAAAQRFSGLHYSVGLHPTSKFPEDFDAAEYLDKWWKMPQSPVAVGECGIDLHWDVNPLTRMQEVFASQLRYAQSRNVPAIIHTRDADKETREVLAQYGGDKVVMHCFNGSAQLLELGLERNWYISFAGNLTFPKAVELHESALKVPLDRLLVETDAPFLAPQPVRGQRCEPWHVKYTAAKLAELRRIAATEMEQILLRNAEECFSVRWSA
jgi:TatD DNase family protein